MKFEWDTEKEKSNIRKHGLDFETAARVFNDENRIELFDEAHSDQEDRFITIGSIAGTVIIAMVSYTERGDVIRIISARKTNDREEKAYYEYNKGYRF